MRGTISVKKENDQIVISGTDQRPGMPEDKQKALASSASYLESGYGAKGEKGSGLGLSLSMEFFTPTKEK